MNNSSWNVSTPYIYNNRPFCPIPLNPGPALLYILIDLAPLIIYFPILILFNFNLASGPAQSFIFFYQALPAAIPFEGPSSIIYSLGGGFISGLLTIQSPITDLILPRPLPYLTLQYCKLLVAVLALVTTVVLVKCIDCPCASLRRPWAKLRRSVRHFREKRALKGTVLNGLCSIAILTYGFVIQQSFAILRQGSHCQQSFCTDDHYHLYYCTELKFSSPAYHPYLAGAVISLVLFLSLPLLLLYYPCVPALMQRITKRSSPLITCHKLAPVFDVFQSAYKPKLRFFAALPLLYRFVIWMLFSTFSAVLTNTNKQLIITLVFILILAIHCLVQPFSKPRHNYIETLYLVNLVLILVLFTVSNSLIQSFINPNDQPNWGLYVAAALLPPTLAYLPIVAGIGYILWKCNCCKRCRSACCKIVKRIMRSRESAEEEDVQVQPTEVYIDLQEVEPTNQA